MTIKQFYSNLLKYVKTHPDKIMLEKLSCSGFFENDGYIILDYRKNMLRTLIHEYLHLIYPKIKEEKIVLLEKYYYYHITSSIIKSLQKEINKL